MKRTIFTVIALAMGVGASAQSMYDALSFAQNDYYGTARTAALGNAVTALGGDLGTVGINPAGSAVNSYSQFTITPGFTISSLKAAYSPDGVAYSGAQKSNYSWANLPNIGANFNMDLHNSTGLRSVAFGFIVNTTSRFSSDAFVSGKNGDTSMLGSFAAAAGGFGADEMNSYNGHASWPAVAAYRSGMIYYDDVIGQYLGASETSSLKGDGTYDIFTAGIVNQNMMRQTRGSKADYVMNVGFNVNNTLFLGFNLGIPTLSYTVDNYLTEYAGNPDDFPQHFDAGDTYWDKAAYRFVYDATMSGIYAKIGAIWTPFSFLRLGAAVQTPTSFDITESYSIYASSSYLDSGYNGSETSPEGTFDYGLRTPLRANFGAAVTLGGIALLSADWELTDYSTMKYRQGPDYDYVDENIIMTNKVMSLFCGTSSNRRYGVEVNLGQFAVRAGLSKTTSGERWYHDNEGYTVDAGEYLTYYDDYQRGDYQLRDKNKVDADVLTKSFGFGYKSSGSFFADFAMRFTSYPSSYLSLYDNYIAGTPSPSCEMAKKYAEALFTVGWRF